MRTVSANSPFIAEDDGTHNWVTVPTNRYERRGDALHAVPDQMDFVRINAGRDERSVCQIMVNKDVNNLPYIAFTAEEMLKTKQSYKSGRGGLVFASSDDYIRFMHEIIEAGVRAGFIG